MPRPPAHPGQHQMAYRLWVQGRGQREIWDALSNDFQNPVSERTVSNWIRGFKNLNPQVVNDDAPFRWHQSELYGLPWEASAFIMRMYRVVYAVNMSKQGTAGPWVPTFREVRWWWRVHLAAPEIGAEDGPGHLFDVAALASQFVYRELAMLVVAEPLRMEDLEALLAVKPWLNDEFHEEYHHLVKLGLIPPLRNPEPREWAAVDYAFEQLDLPQRPPPLYLAADEEHPELLSTQQKQLKDMIGGSNDETQR